MPPITDVVKHLLILNAIIFIAFHFALPHFAPYTYLWFPGEGGNFQPFQLISHMFMHADERHIIFNMLSLFFLGPAVENYLGNKKFLFLYLACGFGAFGLHLLLGYFGIIPPNPIVGASGAIMGVIAAFGTLFPHSKLQLIFPPVPVKAMYFVIAIIAIDVFSGIGTIRGVSSGVAHFAHLGGALTGFILVRLWRSGKFNI